jgi:L-glyceraldehyde 3-phosphate reductase
MSALDLIVRQGKALYIGLSNYRVPEMKEAVRILKELGTPCLIHQPRYNMFDRWIEDGLQDLLEEEGIGSIVFSPLAQGLLTDKYLKGIPADSRAAGHSIFLNADNITQERIEKARQLNSLAQERGQTLAQMALTWNLRGGRVTSVLIGASKVKQVDDCLGALKNLDFSQDELSKIEAILKA